MTHITCRLTAENRDQLRNPTLGNQVRASFCFSRSPRPSVSLPSWPPRNCGAPRRHEANLAAAAGSPRATGDRPDRPGQGFRGRRLAGASPRLTGGLLPTARAVGQRQGRRPGHARPRRGWVPTTARQPISRMNLRHLTPSKRHHPNLTLNTPTPNPDPGSDTCMIDAPRSPRGHLPIPGTQAPPRISQSTHDDTK